MRIPSISNKELTPAPWDYKHLIPDWSYVLSELNDCGRNVLEDDRGNVLFFVDGYAVQLHFRTNSHMVRITCYEIPESVEERILKCFDQLTEETERLVIDKSVCTEHGKTTIDIYSYFEIGEPLEPETVLQCTADDLTSCGYDLSQVNQDTLYAIAAKVRNTLLDGEYFVALRSVCDELGIGKMEE